MYKRVAVLYDGSPESDRALDAAVEIVKSLGSQLHIVMVMAALPLYTTYALVAMPGAIETLSTDRDSSYETLQSKARETALNAGIVPAFHLFKSTDHSEVVELLKKKNANLLVLGLHHKGILISRLWRTVYEFAEDAPCSVLGVH